MNVMTKIHKIFESQATLHVLYEFESLSPSLSLSSPLSPLSFFFSEWLQLL